MSVCNGTASSTPWSSSISIIVGTRRQCVAPASRNPRHQSIENCVVGSTGAPTDSAVSTLPSPAMWCSGDPVAYR